MFPPNWARKSRNLRMDCNANTGKAICRRFSDQVLAKTVPDGPSSLFAASESDFDKKRVPIRHPPAEWSRSLRLHKTASDPGFASPPAVPQARADVNCTRSAWQAPVRRNGEPTLGPCSTHPEDKKTGTEWDRISTRSVRGTEQPPSWGDVTDRSPPQGEPWKGHAT